MDKIDDFRGGYRWLSNYHVSHVDMPDDISYSSSEAAYQAYKTLNMEERRQIALMSKPNDAKRAGRRVELRPDWNEVKDGVMLEVLRIKFSDPILRKMLLETGDAELIEGNYWHDNYWGSCTCAKCGNHGKNMLGRLLMKVREEINETK